MKSVIQFVRSVRLQNQNCFIFRYFCLTISLLVCPKVLLVHQIHVFSKAIHCFRTHSGTMTRSVSRNQDPIRRSRKSMSDTLILSKLIPAERNTPRKHNEQEIKLLYVLYFLVISKFAFILKRRQL